MKQMHILQGNPTDEELAAITTAVVLLVSQVQKQNALTPKPQTSSWLAAARHEGLRVGTGPVWTGNWNKHHHGLCQS